MFDEPGETIENHELDFELDGVDEQRIDSHSREKKFFVDWRYADQVAAQAQNFSENEKIVGATLPQL